MDDLPPLPPLMKDRFHYQDAVNRASVEEVVDRYRTLTARRETLLDKMRFGVLSLNAGTLLAAFSGFTSKFHLDPDSPAGSAAIILLVGGIVTAMLSIQREHTHLINISSKTWLRLAALRRCQATLESPIEQEAMDRYGEELSALRDHPPVDFEHDMPGLALLTISGVAWLLGLAMGLSAI